MSAILERLLGRLPMGWLQLIHRRGRFLAALAGVGFANLLVFFQLGFLGALGTAVTLPYGAMRADILISAPDSRTLTDGGSVARLRMLQALAVPGVADATAVQVGTLPLKDLGGRDLTLTVFGVDPAVMARFWTPEIGAGAVRIRPADTMLIDAGTRFLPPDVIDGLSRAPLRIEALGRSLAITGHFRIGAGFEADGHGIVSDQTFLRLFPDRSARAPKHVLVTVAPGADPEAVAARIVRALPEGSAKVRLLPVAAAEERAFQTVERPVGIIFGFGAVMGVLVGLVIVYQVLSTEVSDHLREYATLKAIGYGRGYFTGVVVEQAVILGLGGFLPGLAVSWAIYGVLASGTGLPIAMTVERGTFVLIGTLLACIASGLMATRRLAAADPAELY
jgi:putative ABC transport system permease protein